MKIDPREIANSNVFGTKVWVCDIRGDGINKFIRHVKPTLCVVQSADKSKSKIYYSNTFFSPLNKNGEVSSKIIRLYDNTGYRSFPGTALQIFTTEEECLECYKLQVKEMLELKTKIAKEFEDDVVKFREYYYSL